MAFAAMMIVAGLNGLSAQKYYIYQFDGNVQAEQDKDMVDVSLRQPLDANQKVFVDDGAVLRLLDMSTHQFKEIKGLCQGKVDELPPEKISFEEVSEKYLRYVYNQLFCRKPISRMSSAVTAVYRDVDGNDIQPMQCYDSIQSNGRPAYYVYSALNASMFVGRDTVAVAPKQKLELNSELILGKSAKAVIFAPEEGLLVLVDRAGRYTIEQLISDDRHRATKVKDDQYIKVCDRIFSDIQ